jgi:hypothetical protein
VISLQDILYAMLIEEPAPQRRNGKTRSDATRPPTRILAMRLSVAAI